MRWFNMGVVWAFFYFVVKALILQILIFLFFRRHRISMFGFLKRFWSVIAILFNISLLCALLLQYHALATEFDNYSQAPGLRCGTPSGWCWALVPGYPGTQCYCPGPNGTVIWGVLF